MSILTFKTRDVKLLVQELDSANSYSPTSEDLFNPAMFLDGIPRNEHGHSEKEANKLGEFFWPSAKYIVQSRIKPALILVGDQGVYLITNAKVAGTPASRGTVSYASGCDPKINDDFYENKEMLFGGDDGSISIPYSWAQWAIQHKTNTFRIKLTANSVEFMQGK
jgi:hypothetical protein